MSDRVNEAVCECGNGCVMPHMHRDASAGRATAAVDVEPIWAHVVKEPESHAPALLNDEALAEINEALADIGAGHFIDRAWIQPGPIHARLSGESE